VPGVASRASYTPLSSRARSTREAGAAPRQRGGRGESIGLDFRNTLHLQLVYPKPSVGVVVTSDVVVPKDQKTDKTCVPAERGATISVFAAEDTCLELRPNFWVPRGTQSVIVRSSRNASGNSGPNRCRVSDVRERSEGAMVITIAQRQLPISLRGLLHAAVEERHIAVPNASVLVSSGVLRMSRWPQLNDTEVGPRVVESCEIASGPTRVGLDVELGVPSLQSAGEKCVADPAAISEVYKPLFCVVRSKAYMTTSELVVRGAAPFQSFYP